MTDKATKGQPGASGDGQPAAPGQSETSEFQQKGVDSLSNIRHSLRTPLNQIIGYSEMLQEEAEELGLAEALPDLKRIHTAGGQLLAMVNNGLAPWRIESGRIDFDSMRHEMRTPLNLIIGYSELCQEESEEKGNQKLTADLKKIDAAARNLLKLFDEKDFSGRLELAQAASRTESATKSVPDRGPGDTTQTSVEEAKVAPGEMGSLLIVDDNDMNRDMLGRRLVRQGYTVTEAENGSVALEKLRSVQNFDLVLLDILMPVMDGFQTLQHIKADKDLRHIPIVMLSALDEVDMAVRCIEIGAEDYIPKPFNPVLLNARIGASLEKKRLRDQEQAFLEKIQIEQEKSEKLLLNILPKSIADRLKQGESTIADSFRDCTVLFADIADFTKLSTRVEPAQMVHLLNDIFSGFDWLAEMHGLEKIKTIGDAYMAVSGVPVPRHDHAMAAAEMALEMQKVISRFNLLSGVTFNIRIGMSSGPVVAGIIGRKKFIYDLWGDTVNIASRMESQGQPGAIQVSQATYDRLRDRYQFEKRGTIEIKGKGEMTTYFLTGRNAPRTG